eukprot:767022-Hanusia_phi.AAC.1
MATFRVRLAFARMLRERTMLSPRLSSFYLPPPSPLRALSARLLHSRSLALPALASAHNLPALHKGATQNYCFVRKMVIARELTEDEYHNIANQDELELLEESDVDLEVEASGDGVINIKVNNKGAWVINKQTPSRQIWFSSPITGPTHYMLEHGEWVCTKDGHNMKGRLHEQLGIRV